MNVAHKGFRMAAVSAAALILAACGGGSKTPTGTITFSMTDAPVDEADMVVIAMEEFEFKPVDGAPFRVPVTELGRQLNLLDFTNGKKAVIIDDEEVPAGEYEWLRIHFDVEYPNSYVRLEEGGEIYQMFMPSGEQTGWKLVNGFTVPVNRPVEYIIDVNVRQSLLEPPGLSSPFGERAFLWKPTARIMNAAETGGVWGVVAAELLAEFPGNEAACGVDDAIALNAVYAFEGHGADPNAASVLTSDIVDYNLADNRSEYHLMYLLPGDYTVAFTCQAGADDGETDPLAGVEFSAAIDVTIVAGELKQCDIPPEDEESGPC
jgi:hypothetical protein